MKFTTPSFIPPKCSPGMDYKALMIKALGVLIISLSTWLKALLNNYSGGIPKNITSFTC